MFRSAIRFVGRARAPAVVLAGAGQVAHLPERLGEAVLRFCIGPCSRSLRFVSAASSQRALAALAIACSVRVRLIRERLGAFGVACSSSGNVTEGGSFRVGAAAPDGSRDRGARLPLYTREPAPSNVDVGDGAGRRRIRARPALGEPPEPGRVRQASAARAAAEPGPS